MVYGIYGLPGAGKTFLLARIGLRAIKEKRKVWANFKLQGAKYFSTLEELRHIREGVILLDEANLSFPSRMWVKMPPEFLYFWSQTRKMQLDIYMSSQHPDRLDKVPKEIMNWAYVCKKLPFKFHIALKFLPEEIGKAKRKLYGILIWRRSKKVENSYNTWEFIELSEHLKNN